MSSSSYGKCRGMLEDDEMNISNRRLLVKLAASALFFSSLILTTRLKPRQHPEQTRSDSSFPGGFPDFDGSYTVERTDAPDPGTQARRHDIVPAIEPPRQGQVTPSLLATFYTKTDFEANGVLLIHFDHDLHRARVATS